MMLQQSNPMLDSADQLAAAGQYREAVEQFNRALAITPDDVDTLKKKADALLALGEAEPALACYDRMIAVESHSSRLMGEKAAVLLALDRYAEAIEYYDKAFVVDPQNVAILVAKAFALRKLDRISEALECLGRALAIRPGDPQALANKGDLLLDLKHDDEAIACFQKAAGSTNDGFAASDWTDWGDRLFQSGRTQEAISFYDRAIAVDKNYVWAWRGKSVALNTPPDRKKEDALACLQQALQIHADPLLWVDEGNLYLSEKRFDEAKSCYVKATQLDPKFFAAWFNTGVALEQEGRFEEAVAIIDKAIEIDPTSSDAWVEKGYCLACLQKLEDSIKCYDRALELSPAASWAWNNKGRALMQLGREEEAIKLFDEAIRIDGAESTPWVNKSRCLLDLERHEEAAQCLEGAQRVVSDQRLIFYYLGLVYSEYMYDHEKAIGLYKQSLSHSKQGDFDDIDIHANIAECLIKLGRYVEGRNLISEIKNQFDDSIRRCALSYLSMASYALEGDRQNRAREFAEFLNRFREWEADERSGKIWDWNFRGLVHSILSSKADPETEFLLLAAADLQQGSTDYLSLLFHDKQGQQPA